MTELNKFNLYNFNNNYSELYKQDEVDIILEKFKPMQEIDEVRSLVEETFKISNGVEWFEYPNNKRISVVIDKEKIEICAIKNNKQFYGKGWKKIQ